MNRNTFSSAVSALALALALACAPEPVESPQAAEAGGRDLPAEAVPLEECPPDEGPWQDALEVARDSATLGEFAARVTELAAACPDLWAPRRAAGEAFYFMREWDKLPLAREHFQAAIELARASGSPLGVARAATLLGGFFVRDRDYAEAERIYLEGLDAALELERTDLEGLLLTNYARVLRETGRFAEAVAALQRARPLLIRHRLDPAALSAGYNESVMLLDLGNTAEAKDRLEEVFERATAANNARIVASSSIALGNLHRLQNRLDEAREWFERVSDGDRKRYADLGLARIALAEEQFDVAEERLHGLIQETGLVAFQARTLQAEIVLRRGDPEGAAALAERLVAEASDDPGAAGFTSRALLGKSLLALGGREDEAIEALRQAVEKIERQGESLTVEQEGVAYLRERAEPYADLAAALALSGADPATIFEVVERAHARALRRVLGGTQVIDVPVLGSVQESLAERDVLLTYLLGEDRGTVVAVTRSSAEAHVIDGLETLRPSIRRLRRLTVRPATTTEADPDFAVFLDGARDLRLRLLGPVEDLIAAPDSRVLIVPDQDLALVPFGALPLRDALPPGFLAEARDVAVLPLAGAAPAWDGPRLPLLLAGDPLPDASGEFESLPMTKRELAGISAVWKPKRLSWLPSGCSDDGGPVTKLERSGLTAEAIRRTEMSAFRTIHLATHAVASSLDPRRCSVILSEGQRLSMDEVAEFELDGALIVLSACRTGEGEIIPGEGVVGLTWAFLHAGARGVAASLWSVEDESAAELMLAFHRSLREGHDPVAALGLAQRERMRTHPHPAHWAPFVVVLKPETR